MKRLTASILYLGLMLTCNLNGQSSIQTHNDFSTTNLVKEILATDACDNISMITPIGDSRGIGYFENGGSVIGLERGIILSTGPTNSSEGPNSSTNTSGSFSDASGDVDLGGLATAQVFDAVGLSFDFVPLDSIVSFRYVFASEEYCEFVGSAYNDVFGFFISGPGINGQFSDNAENVALLPGSSDYVAINTINHAQNANYYNHNELGDDSALCELEGITPTQLNGIEYDGFTSVLTATLRLQPCETYHIRFVVGDVGDEYYDSAVFLEAGSFNLGGQVSLTAFGGSAGQYSVYEGCNDAFFRFQRSADSPASHPLPITYELGALSTAESGSDFQSFTQHTIIPAGASYIDLPLNTLLDNEAEGSESVQLLLDIPCACYRDSASLFIIEAPPLEMEAPDAYFCPNDEVTMDAIVNGGSPPYQYQWSTGGNEPIEETPTTNGNIIYVTVTDACQQAASDTLTTWLADPPSAYLEGTFDLCSGDTTWYAIDLQGTPPFELYYALDGVVQAPEIIDSLGQVPFTLGGEYTFLEIHDAACIGEADGEITINELFINELVNIVDISCFGFADGSIDVSLSGDNPPFVFDWLQNVPQELSINNLSAGEYELHVIDSLNCEKTISINVEEPMPISIDSIDCEALFSGNTVFSASGGIAPYLYRLQNGSWIGEQIFNDLTAGLTYQMEVQDANGCESSFDWIVPADLSNGMGSIEAEQTIALGTQWPLMVNWNISPNLIQSVQWTPPTQLNCPNCESPIFSALNSEMLTLAIEDIFGCTDTIVTHIEVKDEASFFAPNVFSPNGDENNDLWTIYASPFQVEFIENIQIFDRWGGILYTAKEWPLDSDRFGWNGRSNGEELEQGVYVFMAELRLVNGKTQRISGDILLLRH